MSDVTPELSAKFTRKEANLILALLFTIGILTVLDVYEDWLDGATLYHIVPELIMAASALLAARILLLQLAESRREAVLASRAEADEAKRMAFAWKGKADELRRGISETIGKQLSAWQLTEAESDIAFLLLKGLSTAEIAKIRDTSERTIRNQTSDIYSKSGLSGRAQLAAYFLEDLFDRS
ncbi:MAG: hypothetical protein DCC75_04295 [Proteobacteria bacterium]|nr:MAG: hypothetical protein DCC75_04295 [Pseudomonadota bacterium]